jgi:DNA-binding response OmpR family regulator
VRAVETSWRAHRGDDNRALAIRTSGRSGDWTGELHSRQMAAAQTVLIVEDDEAIADSVAYHLSRAGYRTLIARDGAKGLRLFRSQRPNLVILDLMLPQMDGWRFTEELRRDDEDVPIIVCSARTSEFDRVNGLEVGADDYVTKPFSMRELVARVNAHLRRAERSREADGSGVIAVEELVIDPDQIQAFVNGTAAGLTPREFEVLHALARSAGKPVPRERLYREVWGYEMLPGDRSVDVFIRKVRRKIEALEPAHTYIQTHYGVGYRFEAQLGGESPHPDPDGPSRDGADD